jgi:glutamate---cysteine ligase / carboxylate-amine ligase
VALESGGDLKPVVDSLLAEMRDGLPTTGPAGSPADCAGGHAA